MEQDFLQSIKLEISRAFTLNAYERIAFHKILAILKTDNGMKILMRDLTKPGAIRKSALATLIQFEGDELNELFIEMFNSTENKDELRLIFEFFEKRGSLKEVEHLMNFINKWRSDNSYANEINRAIFLVGWLGYSDSTYTDFLISIALSKESPSRQRLTAIEALQHHKDLDFFESILNENNSQLSLAVFKSLANISQQEISKYSSSGNDLFTKSPDQGDTFLLNIRVLLSKMSKQFEEYGNETKVAYIKALLSCNHREYLVYISKALTTPDPSLIDMTLYAIYSMVNELQNPDKLFRNLISLASITQRDDQIIVEIFVKYFTNLRSSRTNNLIRDKLYNYIIVMLDSFFENYRKTYMIKEKLEKVHDDVVQKIRAFILDKLDPALKRRVIKYLTTDDIEFKSLLIEISEKISFIHSDEEESLYFFLEALFDTDKKAGEILASRIGDIDFEKRYLKHRIIRLCRIIGELGIEEASSSLVKMFNYIKKYYESDLYEAVAYSLSQLNYPYMLGELEVLLAGSDENVSKNHTLMLLSQFREHRALFIMLEYLKDNYNDTSETTETVLSVLLRKDVKSDKSSNEIAKVIAEKNRKPEIRVLAIQLLGKTAFEKDILYLHEFFIEESENQVKEAIVQAMDSIANLNNNYKKKDLAPFLKGYLKDPSIRVRIYSCIILLQIGDIGALTLLKDMMVIKNKGIQREILLLLGGHMSIELAFFLISLMREEYAISHDIIPLLQFLQHEDKVEVDYFISNIFKKHEGTRVEYNQRQEMEKNQIYNQELQQFQHDTKTVLRLHLYDIMNTLTRYRSTELAMHFRKPLLQFAEIIKSYNGIVSRVTAGELTVFFQTTPDAAMAAIELLTAINDFNYIAASDEKVKVLIFIEQTEMVSANDEILFFHDYEYSRVLHTGLENRAILDRQTADNVNTAFNSEPFPESAFTPNGTELYHNELINALNFIATTDEMLVKIKRSFNERKVLESELDNTQLKHHNFRSQKAQEIMVSMNDIGKLLKKDLNEVMKYVKKRSTDRELIRRTEKMIADTYKHYNIEVSKLDFE